ncbi:hypothetical protein AB0M54_37280 [Actinoplanes sp. NPDC051470]|uniref:hypothetical protein n=1 Tax=Actinoplanes sp. NPDC051470 TaxID=3157224 RepID=UPI00342888B8
MSTSSRNVRRLTVAVAMALLLGACRVEGGERLSDTEIEQIRDVLTTTTTPQPSGAVDEYQSRWDAVVTACMAADGLPYRPWHRPLPPPLASGLAPAEFAATAGFGISTSIGSVQPGRPVVDPNRQALRTLSAEQRQAYRSARDACDRRAMSVLGVPPISGAGEFVTSSAVGDQLREIATAAERDARVVRARAAYRSCMSAAGQPASTPAEVTADFQRKARPYTTAFQAQATARADRGGDPSDLTLAEVFPPPRLAQLRRLQREEIAVAVVEQPCGTALNSVVEAVHREYELSALHQLPAR